MAATRSEKPLGRNPILRLMVLAPFALSASAALLVLALAPGTWGAAGDVGLASWAPAAGLLIVALPVLVIAVWAATSAWRRTTGLFEVDLTWASVGAVAHWLAAITLVMFAGTAGSRDSYQSLGVDNTSTAGFLTLAVVFCALFDGIVGALTLVYIWSIEPGPKTRIAQRRDDEVDFVAEWTRRRPRTR
jgi:hypothetical protein